MRAALIQVTTAVALIAPLGACGYLDSLGSALQKQRETIIMDFSTNPTTARQKYTTLVSRAVSVNRETLAEQIVVCGQLMRHGLNVPAACASAIDAGFESAGDPELQGIAVSALAFAQDSKSLEMLEYAYREGPSIARVEAASSIAYRMSSDDIQTPDGPRPSEVAALVSRLCSEDGLPHTSNMRSLCENP